MIAPPTAIAAVAAAATVAKLATKDTKLPKGKSGKIQNFIIFIYVSWIRSNTIHNKIRAHNLTFPDARKK